MKSWRDLKQTKESKAFVGRKDEQDIFRSELLLSPPNFTIFYLQGQGGVGKSTLLRRYQEIARANSFLIAETDEKQRDVPSVLGQFANQLAKQGFPLKSFEKLCTLYRQKREEIENDPKAPKGLAGLVGRTVVRTAFADTIPGVRKGTDLLPQDAIATQASQWTEYLVNKFTGKDEVALMLDPIVRLTPLFFTDLNEIAQKHPILLCFENFEQTRQYLQEWLLTLPETDPSPDLGIRMTFAGRNLPGAGWEPMLDFTKLIPLDIFPPAEAEAFLDRYGIQDVQRHQEILHLSNRLPVLMSWLAAPDGITDDGDLPTQDIVKRFLRWVTDPILQDVVLLAAVPRNFNRCHTIFCEQ